MKAEIIFGVMFLLCLLIVAALSKHTEKQSDKIYALEQIVKSKDCNIPPAMQ